MLILFHFGVNIRLNCVFQHGQRSVMGLRALHCRKGDRGNLSWSQRTIGRCWVDQIQLCKYRNRRKGIRVWWNIGETRESESRSFKQIKSVQIWRRREEQKRRSVHWSWVWSCRDYIRTIENDGGSNRINILTRHEVQLIQWEDSVMREGDQEGACEENGTLLWRALNCRRDMLRRTERWICHVVFPGSLFLNIF